MQGPEFSIPAPRPQQPQPPSGARADGRRPDQVRPIYVSTGINKQANGSAIYESGNLKVVCAVYGPRQLTSRQTHLVSQSTTAPETSSTRSSSGNALLQCDFKFAPFAGPGGLSAPRRAYNRTEQERTFSRFLDQALSPAIRLDMYPKSTIHVYVLVLESDGALASLSAAVTASSLALADAGIELFDLVTSCTAGLNTIPKQNPAPNAPQTSSNSIYLDPTHTEETDMSGHILIAYMPSLNDISHVIQSGEITLDQSVKAVELCVDACSQILTVTQQPLLKST